MLQNEDGGNDFLKPYLKAQNIRWEYVDLNEMQEMWFSANEIRDYRVQVNDLLVSEGGEVGRTAIWHGDLEECYIQNSVHIVRVDENKANSRFILFVLEALGSNNVFNAIVNRVSIAHLTRDKLKEVMIPCPSLSEQNAIVTFLDGEAVEIDEVTKKIKSQIEKLQEYRRTLITKTVAGKIMIM